MSAPRGMRLPRCATAWRIVGIARVVRVSRVARAVRVTLAAFVTLATFIALAALSIPACHASPPAGHLPMHYRIEPANYPWTGRLHAVTFRTASLDDGPVPVMSQWEAGQRLDRRDPASRHLYVGGARMAALHWHALDDDARDRLAGGVPAREGKRRISWLRGQFGMPDMRPRDTRLGHAADARVHVVPPPIWQPLMPGHDTFRATHARRPHTVWLGTRTGFVHGFDAVTGHEIAAYLPRALLTQAGALAEAGPLPPLRVPCPRPDTIDADLRGTWRTLLLCGVPAPDEMEHADMHRAENDAPDAETHPDDAIDDITHAPMRNEMHHAMQDRAHDRRAHEHHRRTAAIFALDITAPDAHRPLSLIWELAATDTLPLTGSGPLRAAASIEHGTRRWYAVAIVAHADHAGIAMVPLDAPPTRDIGQMLLPPQGCDGTQRAGRLLAASVLADARGLARSIHAIDDAGQLWRFPFPWDAATGPSPTPVCVLKLRGGASRRAEAPLILPGVVVPLVAVGSGSEVAVVPATPTVHASTARTTARTTTRTTAARAVIRARRQHGDSGGVTLRADGATDHGWTFVLPHAGERFERWLPAGHAHLAFTTVSADGGRRSYLVDAMHGVSPVVTGLPAARTAPIVTTTPIHTDAGTAPGMQRRDIEAVTLWAVGEDDALPQQPLQYIRRRGRLGWRELTRSSP